METDEYTGVNILIDAIALILLVPVAYLLTIIFFVIGG